MKQWIKIISSGHIMEIYTYERMPIPNRNCKKDDATENKKNERDIGAESAQNDRKSKWNFIRQVNMNFEEHSKFVTLTFAENVTDLDEANKQFKRFIQRMRYKYGAFKYAVAIEFQKRGAAHYHMMSNLPYIPKKELAEIWRQGFVRINDIKHVDNVGAYLSKYMTKGDGRDPRLRGRKMYLTSKNMDKPSELKGDDADQIIKMYSLEQKKAVLESSYDSEHHGTITYRQYNLKRND